MPQDTRRRPMADADPLDTSQPLHPPSPPEPGTGWPPNLDYTMAGRAIRVTGIPVDVLGDQAWQAHGASWRHAPAGVQLANAFVIASLCKAEPPDAAILAGREELAAAVALLGPLTHALAVANALDPAGLRVTGSDYGVAHARAFLEGQPVALCCAPGMMHVLAALASGTAGLFGSLYPSPSDALDRWRALMIPFGAISPEGYH